MREGIHYVKRQEVNATKWDRCIDQASNGLIYAYSFYLDTMTDSWDALVLNDYEALMPLPWKKKIWYSLFVPARFYSAARPVRKCYKRRSAFGLLPGRP